MDKDELGAIRDEWKRVMQWPRDVDMVVHTAAHMFPGLLAEVERLQAREAAMREIAQAVADVDWDVLSGDGTVGFRVDDVQPIVDRAIALLKESGTPMGTQRYDNGAEFVRFREWDGGWYPEFSLDGNSWWREGDPRQPYNQIPFTTRNEAVEYAQVRAPNANRKAGE